jgi:hypothetical protein
MRSAPESLSHEAWHAELTGANCLAVRASMPRLLFCFRIFQHHRRYPLHSQAVNDRGTSNVIDSRFLLTNEFCLRLFRLAG